MSYQQTDSTNYGFAYAYNLANEMTTETYPSGRQVITEYDTAGRAAGVRAAAVYYAGATAIDATNRIQYASHGAVSVMKLGNGKWEHATYDPKRLQPTQIGLGTSGTDSSILKLDYGYGATSNNGNVTSQTITIGSTVMTQSYSYDALNRLQSASENSGASWSQSYGFDRYGNRWVSASTGYTLSTLTPTSSGAFNTATNRLFASGYDGAGNQTSDALSRQFTYDSENRQLTFNATGGQYFYDGDGHRVKKVTGSITTIFVNNAMGQPTAEYTNDTTPPVGGGGTSYLTSDHLGSTRLVMKSDGTTVKARYDYLPFGEEIPSTVGSRGGVTGYGGPDSTRQKFTQKERDSESGLDYFLARYYSSAQGRFTSADPKTDLNNRVIDPARWNMYVYVRNNPLASVDPDGKADKGSGGGKVIDIYIALSRRDFRQGNKFTSFSALRQFGKKHGYSINVHSYNESTFDNVKASVNNANMTIIDAHGVYQPGDATHRAWGIKLKDSIMAPEGKVVQSDGKSVVAEERPSSSVNVLGLFGCNTTYMGSPVAPEGPGLKIVSINSGKDGETTVPAITASLQAFIKGYINSGEDVMAAAKAGTAALEKADQNPQNKGDSLSILLYDVNLLPKEETKKPPQ